MALLGPKPTPASVSSLVRNAEDEQLFEIFEEVIQFTDGPVLINLAANKQNRAKLRKFLTPEKLEEVFPLLADVSDPKFVALSFLADEDDALRPEILKLLQKNSEYRASLTVYSRLLAKSKLELLKLETAQINKILEWAILESSDDTLDETERRHWSTLATLLIKALATTHRDHLISYVKDNQDQDAAFATVRSAVDELPELAEPILESFKDLDTLSIDYLFMLSTMANTANYREKIKTKFMEKLSTLADDGSVIAGVIEAKILASTTSQTGDIYAAAARLDVLSKQLFEENIDEVGLEGLACTAILATVRDRVSNDKQKRVIKGLVALLKKNPGPTAYAVFALLTQLVKFPIKPTKEEEQQNELRLKSVGKNVSDIEAEVELDDENDKFHARQESGRIADQIFATNVVNWLTINAPTLSTAAHTQLATLLRELASHQEFERRQELGIQGAVIVATFLWSTDKPAKIDPTAKSDAASVISKILATVPPQISLTDRVSTLVVVTPLCLQIDNEHSKRKNLDTFEALRALTNLASGDSDKLRTAIANTVWNRLFAALNSDFVQIRRASLELVCNLMMVPASAQMFLQHTQESDDLLTLLGKSVIVEDEDSRLAAAGAIAILAEWETAPEAIGRNKDCIIGLSHALGLYMMDDPLLMRVLAALKTILKATTAEMDDEVVERIVFFEGVTYLEQLVDTIDPLERTEVSKRVLQCIKLIAEYKAKTPTA